MITFSEALDALKSRKKVARNGWNGKGMFLVLFDCVGHGLETLNVAGYGENPLHPFILMKTADDMWVPWLASQTDILAEDWMVIL